MIDTSTAIMVRLFVKPEGEGRMLASVPIGLLELAHRIAVGSVYGDKLGQTAKGRVSFVIEPEVWDFIDDMRNIPMAALKRDRQGLQEVLARIALSGFPTNVLLREEYDYLVHCVGEGNWQRGLAYVGDEMSGVR